MARRARRRWQNAEGNRVRQDEAQFIRDFKRYDPSAFDGKSERSSATEEWIKALEKLFEYMGCGDDLKVRAAIFMLQDEAVY